MPKLFPLQEQEERVLEGEKEIILERKNEKIILDWYPTKCTPDVDLCGRETEGIKWKKKLVFF